MQHHSANSLAIFGGTPVRTQPFPAWPVFDESEEKAILEVLRSGEWWRNTQGESQALAAHADDHSSKIAEFEEAFALFHQAGHGVACANGTAALEIVLKAAGVGLGDEVIVPPYTFIATATAPLAVQAIPVFCDISCETLNLNPARLEAVITPRTRAIIPVHFAGLPADMERILAIARQHNLLVIEDAAHAHGSCWNQKKVGTLGFASIFSFQASKNMTAGEGGMILTNNDEFATLCESYLWAGRIVGRPWYEHHRLGWNYRLTEFQAAILLQQLHRLEGQNRRRTANGLYLNKLLAEIPGISPIQIPSFVSQHSFHIYAFRILEEEFGAPRCAVLDALQAEGIPCSGGYAHPLYRNPLFLNREFYPNGATADVQQKLNNVDYAAFAETCPDAERACRETIWLEHRILLSEPEEMNDIVAALRKIYDSRESLRAPVTTRQ